MVRGSALLGALCLLLTLTAGASPPVTATPDCRGGVDVRPVSIQVDGEEATGRVYEPYRCAAGDLPPRALVIAVHGHGGSSADYASYLTSLSRRTGTPFLSMDLRSATSVWRTGEWNLWAGWRDLVAATEWYRSEHPGIDRTVLWGWSQGGITSGLAAAHGPRGLFDYCGPGVLRGRVRGRAIALRRRTRRGARRGLRGRRRARDRDRATGPGRREVRGLSRRRRVRAPGGRRGAEWAVRAGPVHMVPRAFEPALSALPVATRGPLRGARTGAECAARSIGWPLRGVQTGAWCAARVHPAAVAGRSNRHCAARNTPGASAVVRNIPTTK